MVISRTSAIPLETSGNAIMAQLDVNVVTRAKDIGIPTFQVTNTVMSSMKHVLKLHVYFILSSEIYAYQKQIKVISITSEMI